jgi:hypothetical protein
MNCSTIRNITNSRIYERNLPSAPLQQYTSFRSVPTKYSHMPIVDPRSDPASFTPVSIMPTYKVNATFNPGNTAGPWSGYATNIDSESVLRDQVYPLSDCLQSKFIPGSNSDMYVNYMGIPGHDNGISEFPNLFKTDSWCLVDPGRDFPQKYVFNSSTRVSRN